MSQVGLDAFGIIDGDFHPEEFSKALPQGLHMLPVHEVESLFALPAVVAAVCKHLGADFDPGKLPAKSTVSDDQANAVMLSRWKRRLEPRLEGLLSSFDGRGKDGVQIASEMPAIFDHTNWSFSPAQFLTDEAAAVSSARAGSDVIEFLRVFPGKQMLPVAALVAELRPDAYRRLVVQAVAGTLGNDTLTAEIVAALEPMLPARFASVLASAQVVGLAALFT